MEILRNGKFSEVLDFHNLKKGLQKNENQPRNALDGLSDLNSMIGKDNAFVTLSSLSRIDTDVITDSFPYPQFFNLTNYMLICGETKIYEYDGTTLTLKITASKAANVWKVTDFIEFLYMSNGAVAIKKDAQTLAYSETTVYPIVNAMCNFNGQVLVGGKGVDYS